MTSNLARLVGNLIRLSCITRIPVCLAVFLSTGMLLHAEVISVVISNDPSLKTPYHLAADGTNLLVNGMGTDNQQHIYSVPMAGGAATQLYNAAGPIQIAVAGADLFWIDPNSGPATDTQIWKAPKNGSGSPTAIYTGSSAGQPIVDGSGLAAGGSLLYAADEYAGKVWRLNPDGSGLTQLGPARYSAGFGPEHMNTIAVDQGVLYLADYGHATYSIPPQVVSIATNGSSFTTLASGSPLGHPADIAVGNGKVFVTDYVATNTIWQLPVRGGTPTAYVSGAPFTQLVGLVFCNGALYVADSGAGAIYRITTAAVPTAPVISSFNPGSGPVNTQVAVTGLNFVGVTAVSFNGVAAPFTTDSATQLTTTVPAEATTGPISVTTPEGTANSSSNFVVLLPPVIASFSPSSGPTGTVVTVTGQNFVNVTAVTFNGTAAASFSTSSETELTATVPLEAATGPISVTTPGGTATTSSNFVVLLSPAIASFSPSSGLTGTVVTITGSGFGDATSVRFNGTTASFTVDSATQLTATVPAGAATGPISVTTPGGTATTTTNFVVQYLPVISSFTPVFGNPGTELTIVGQYLGDATAVTVGGYSAAIVSATATQVRATVPSASGRGLVAVTTPTGMATSSNLFTYHTPNSTIVGPVYPPPLGVTFSQSGTSNDGTIGRASGKTWFFSNMALANSAVVFWGATNGGVRLSFRGGVHPYPSAPSEILSYASSLSSLDHGILVWTGMTYLLDNGAPVYTRFTLRIMDMSGNGLPLMDAATLGLPATVGGALVVTPGLAYQANFKFEASYSPNSGFQPALDFYDAQSNYDGTAFSSFAGAFYFENLRPFFTSGPFQNYTLRQTSSFGPIYFSFYDYETGPSSVAVPTPCTSTNQSLLPNNSIIVTRTGANTAFLQLHPNPTVSGQTLVTVALSDGFATNSQSFLLTINEPPTISDITDKVTNVNNSSGPHAFTIGDVDNDPATLTLSATSGNPALLDVTNIVFNGTDADRTVTLTPTTGLRGSALVTIRVSDGIATNSESFTLTVNDPPILTQNTPLFLLQGQTAPINDSLLVVSDTESGPARLAYTVGFGANGGPPREGVLSLNGTNLTTGSVFTQDDLNNGRLSYTHNNGCGTNDDFQFNVSDGDGGLAPTGTYSTYTFRIFIAQSNHPPVALHSNASVGLGATVAGALGASDSDCPPVNLTFRIVANGTKGTLTLTNPGTGEFLYTAAAGQTGTDTVSFQVNDGALDSLSPGVLTFDISNQPPTGIAGSGTTLENLSFNGTLVAADPDRPAQMLTYRIGANGLKGSAALVDAASGAFVYTPHPGATGSDTFTFIANDGQVDSAPAAFNVTIRPNLDPGDILVTDNRAKSLLLIDASGSQFVLSAGTNLVNPAGVALEPAGTVVVMDSASGVVRINPTNGAQVVVSPATNFSTGPLGPVGIAVEANGSILVADGLNGLVRIHPVTGAKTVLASSGHLVLPEGVAIAPNGDIYAADVAAFAGQPSRIVRVDPDTGAQTLVASGGNLIAPVGIALDTDGTIVVSDAATFAGAPYDSVLRIDPLTGAQTIIATNSLLAMPTGLALASGKRILTANNGSGALVQMNGATGAQSILSSGGYLAQPFSLAVVHSVLLRAPTLLTNGQFKCLVFGEPGETYRMEASSNLRTWSAAGAVSCPSGTAEFIDPTAGNFPQRFYRAVQGDYSGLALANPARLSGGQFSLTVLCPAGQVIDLEAGTNLVNWAAIARLTNTTGVIQFTDPAAAGFSRRFYRAMMP